MKASEQMDGLKVKRNNNKTRENVNQIAEGIAAVIAKMDAQKAEKTVEKKYFK